MLKLMKYEVKKQWLSKVVIFIAAIVFEIGFLIGLLSIPGNNFQDGVMLNGASAKLLAISTMLLFFLAVGALSYISFECIGTYSRDMKTKNSYMLFMTPHTSYAIVGAKLLTTAIQLFISTFLFCAVGAIDVMIFITKAKGFAQLKDYAVRGFNALFQIDFDQKFFYVMCIYLLVLWIGVLMTAIFSITLSSTFLANNRLKGLISFGTFCIINWGYNKLMSLILTDNIYRTEDWIPLIIGHCILILIGYFGTSYMLERKVNL